MYAVTGVTGTTGSIVARRLLQQGKKVRVILRNREHIYKWKERGAEVVVADYTDAQAMTFVLEGVEGVYLICPPSYKSHDPMAASLMMAGSLVTAIKNSGVPHVVFLSSLGARQSEKNGILNFFHDVEQKFKQSGIGMTILRAAYFMENWVIGLSNAQEKSSLLTFIQPVDRAIRMVSVEDVGQAAADCLLNPVDGARVVGLCGPREYSPMDVTQVLSAAYKKLIEPYAMPRPEWEDYFIAQGLSREMAGLLVKMFDGLNNNQTALLENGVECCKGTVTLEQALGRLAL